MKRKDAKCRKCGGDGELHGSDHTNEYGPWYISCKKCGDETDIWRSVILAWKSWSLINGGK